MFYLKKEFLLNIHLGGGNGVPYLSMFYLKKEFLLNIHLGGGNGVPYTSILNFFFFFFLMDSLCAAVGSKQVTIAEPPSGECFFNYSFPVNAIAISVQSTNMYDIKRVASGFTLHVRLEKGCMQ